MFARGNAPARVIMGAAALDDLDENARDTQSSSQTSLQPEARVQATPQVPQSVGPAIAGSAVSLEKVRSFVLQALTDGNQRILVSMLEAGEWSVEENEIVIKVPESQTVIEMSLGAEGRRLAIASASGVLGRAVKVKIVPGGAVATTDGKRNGASKTERTNSGPGGRSRAEQDAVVRRMQEKFGAAIRTVIDYKEKR